MLVDFIANVNLVPMNPTTNPTRPEEEALEDSPDMERRDAAAPDKLSGHEKIESKPKDSEAKRGHPGSET